MTISLPSSSTGVHRIWRTMTIGLFLGLSAHLIFARPRELPPLAVAPISGQDLPTPDPRLNQVFDSVDFDRAKLIDVLDSLAKRTGMNLVVVWKSIEKDGVANEPMGKGSPAKDSLITLHLKKVSLATALDAVLELAMYKDPIRWNEFGGVVTIATEGSPEDHVYIRIYDLNFLIGKHQHTIKISEFNSAGQMLNEDDMDAVRKYITDNVLTTTWKDNGGEIGTISQFGNTLIIRQTAQAHHQIEAVLKLLEEQK